MNVFRLKDVQILCVVEKNKISSQEHQNPLGLFAATIN